MDLYLLAELKTISLKVTTVDMQKPPPDFRLVTPKILCWKDISFRIEGTGQVFIHRHRMGRYILIYLEKLVTVLD